VAKKKSCDKKQRTPRNVPVGQFKEINRTGGRSPQPRRITRTDKVQAIQNTVLKESKFFLSLDSTEMTDDLEQHIKFLCGLSKTTSLRESTVLAAMAESSEEDFLSVLDIVDAVQVKAAEKAFYKACKVVPDSECAYIGDSTALAVHGRGHIFFSLLQHLEEEEMKAEAARRAQNRKRPQGNRGAHPAQVRSANVAMMVAQASGR
jgi:hypothetical protein